MVPALEQSPRKDHVFLSYATADAQAARQFAETLRRNGIEVWFDRDNIRPGDPWIAALEEAISDASAMVVYIGRLGIQAWVDREVRFGLVRNTRDHEAFRLIPVLGEGADPARLPPFVQQQQFVDLRDPQHAPEQIRRLIDTLRNPSTFQAGIPPEYWTEHSPFRSLQVFSPEDSWLFFGRDRDNGELLARLARAPTLAVIGNSGSGKSSLIQAGLIPALRRGRFQHAGKCVDSWRIAVFRPSTSPFDYLAETLPGQLAPDLGTLDRAKFIADCKQNLPAGGEALRTAIAALVNPKPRTEGEIHVLLVADQFEELFTLVPDPAVHSRYIDSLLAAARLDSAVPVRLVLALRADFYGHCLEHPKLRECLDTNVYNVPLMRQPQLREAIENRLALAAARAEAGLIDALLADVGAEPGNLALLEHALAQLWEKSGGCGHTLTNHDYAEIGRLKGALGRHADAVYHALDGDAERRLARRILLELVQLGEGAQDTRRRVAKEALFHLAAREQVEGLIALLASNRLVATSGQVPESPAENFVEVSHEALIREWPALREWLKDNREDLRLGRSLLQAAEEWRGLNRDPSALMQGVRLAQGREWLGRHPDTPPLLGEFLTASGDAEETATLKEREARERERRSAVRNRRFSYALSVLFLIATGAAWLARQQQLISRSQTLAAQAEQILVRDQPAALELAIRGWQTAKTPEARLAVAHAFPQLLAKLEGHKERVWRAVFSPDGQRIVTASEDHTARVWNAANGKLLTALEGHTNKVWQAAFSPDGQRIVTASEDRTARVWNAFNGQLLAKLEGHTDDLNQAAFSPDGQRIVTASDDHTARVWNAANGHLLIQLTGHTDNVKQAAFSPDGKRLVTASEDYTARVWNAADGQLVAKLEGHKHWVNQAAFSPDGQRIVTASEDYTAGVWNAANGRLLGFLEGHTDNVNQAAFSPDGQRIVTASEDGTARVWNAANGQLLARLEGHKGIVENAAFSPDGQRIVTASWDKTARIWNVADGQLLASLEGHTDNLNQAAFSPDGQRIVTASDDHTARLWNAANGQLMVKLEGDTRAVWQAAFSPDGQRIVTASGDGTARVWSAANGQPLAKLEGHTDGVNQAAFSRDGQRIVTASEDKTARVWNASNGQLVASLVGHTNGVRQAEFSPDGRRIVTASNDHTARVWNAGDGQLLASLVGHTDSVWQVAFSPDGQRIVTASLDNTARVWNAANGQLLVSLVGHTNRVRHAEFSIDGQRIVTASDDDTARVWNAASGQLLASLVGHARRVEHVAFSPDGHRIVTASYDGTARVWSATDGQLLARLEGHKGSVEKAAFSPDGQRIVTVSWDKTARIWNAADGQLLASLEGHTDILNQAAFSPDGQRIVTASHDYTARVYRIVTLPDIARILGN
jgi:WD40 repeat protein